MSNPKESEPLDKINELSSRKAQHVKLVAEEDVSVAGSSTLFEYFDIIPAAIPDIDFDEVSTVTSFLGHEFQAPILVAGMTGGYPEAEAINKKIAKVCEELGIPMGVGSQRAMVENPDLSKTFNVKSVAPDVFLIGNLGLVQFNIGYGVEEANRAVELIDADALAVHFNAFQELMQPEGDTKFGGSWQALKSLCQNVDVPVIGKEVGCGISWNEVVRLQEIGCAAVDVGGAGGTSWAKIEVMRHPSIGKDDPLKPFDVDDPTLKWGIPTSISTWEATAKSTIPIIATGGMYHPLYAAKALLMGARMVGIARPVLQALLEGGEKGVRNYLLNYIYNIKRIMFLVGAKSVDQLPGMRWRLVPWGKAKDWLEYRNLL